MVRQLNFITSNKNKLSEVTQILGDLVELQSQPLELCEIQGSIEEISLDKCRRAAEKVGQIKNFRKEHRIAQIFFLDSRTGSC